MPKTFTESVFSSTYKDDFIDSDNYHRILFNSGRALQARELTQMQTLLQAQFYALAKRVVGESGILDAPLTVRRNSGSAGSPSNFTVTLNPGHVLIRPQDKDLGYAVYLNSTKSKIKGMFDYIATL